ncbi:VIT family-domain-containing protein [Scleroderma yunnanense]
MSSQVHGAPSIPITINRTMNSPPNQLPWSLESTPGITTLDLQTRSDRCRHEGSVCCGDFKYDDNRILMNPDIVRDVVIGLSDGLTVPFALTAGLSSLGKSRFVVMGGIAELIAGAISMGIGGFLASQAERDHYRFLRRQTSSRILSTCVREMEKEVFSVLGPVGVDERTAREVAKCLRDVEHQGTDIARTGTRTRTDIGDEEKQQTGQRKDVGLTPFLLKFGQGLEEVPTKRLYISAITIGAGYLVGGMIPLFPYFFISSTKVALLYSCILTSVVLLAFGAVKSRVTGAANGPLEYLWGAVSMLMVGGAAAAAAYGMVVLLEKAL